MDALLKSAIDIKGPAKCWPWKLSQTSDGYGQVWRKGIRWRAHRLVYTQIFGNIPNGMQVLHKCDNTLCCNPNHLFLGTHQDNMRDKVRKGRQSRHAGKWYGRDSKGRFIRRLDCI